jgi:acetyl-CoA carboxylase biotin carboxylase subunit
MLLIQFHQIFYVIEEAPAPQIPHKLRKKFGEIVSKACKHFKYVGAGTFEFLYENQEFYFIEMNTRIQVEHPVTELITGIDLIKAQITIAAGEVLPFAQKDILCQGHAIECRINAEHPQTFMPAAGVVTAYHAPGGLGIRLDSHLYQGYKVPHFYDSLLAKIISYGTTRKEAIARMKNALEELVIEGVINNATLHEKLMNDPLFQQGATSIHYLEEKMKLK